MLANFFSLGDRKYLNNAVVIAHLLQVLKELGIGARDLKIKFKKPFNTQGDLVFSDSPVEGPIMGSFMWAGKINYFAYSATDIPLTTTRTGPHLYFDICWKITDTCRGVIESAFEKEYGPMTSEDKVIFAIFEMPDTRVFNDLTSVPEFRVSEAEKTGERRWRVAVYVGDVLLGYRYSTVGKFVL